ncbi:MAG: RNA polymerase sigma factor [Solirubrobacteraceae bacterium]
MPDPFGTPPRRRRGASARREPASILAEHATLMLRIARPLSYCEADAHDAVQAAAERFLRHHERLEAEGVAGWLVTVTRREALRVRGNGGRTEALDEILDRVRDDGAGPDELVARGEELAVARELIAQLKPAERQALWLQAEGLSYREIAQQLDWTGTKVNRSIAEGRSRLKVGLGRIASGEGCAAVGPAIDRLADGRADADDLVALRPHLRRCGACRVRLRRARGGPLSVLPPFAVALLPWLGGGGDRAPRTRVGEVIAERMAPIVPGVTGSATETGLALTAGLAAAVLGAGTLVGSQAGDGPRDQPVLLQAAPSTMSVSARDLGTVATRRATVPTASDRRTDRAVEKALATSPTTALARRRASASGGSSRRPGSTGSAPQTATAQPATGSSSGWSAGGPSSGAAAREFGFE